MNNQYIKGVKVLLDEDEQYNYILKLCGLYSIMFEETFLLFNEQRQKRTRWILGLLYMTTRYSINASHYPRETIIYYLLIFGTQRFDGVWVVKIGFMTLEIVDDKTYVSFFS